MELEEVIEEEDLSCLHNVLAEFVTKTGSDIAKQLLKNWPQSADKFVKVQWLQIDNRRSNVNSLVILVGL